MHARVLVLLLMVPLVTGCAITTPALDEPKGTVIEARDVLLTGTDITQLDGAQALDETEPFASTVDDYLTRRATDLPPIVPAGCGVAVVDLVLLDRDAGAAGAIYSAPGVRLENGFGLVQTGREFASVDAAEAWFADYREVLEGCPAFTVETPDGDVDVVQTVEDAGFPIDGFVVRLVITAPDGTTSYTEQWMLRDGPFAVLVSSASDDSGDEALLPAVDLLRDRLVAAVDAAAVGEDAP